MSAVVTTVIAALAAAPALAEDFFLCGNDNVNCSSLDGSGTGAAGWTNAAGKDELLAELLKSYEKATDYADWENVPNRSNFQALHDKALEAFKK